MSSSVVSAIRRGLWRLAPAPRPCLPCSTPPGIVRVAAAAFPRRARRGTSLLECVVAAALLAGAALTLGRAQVLAWRAVARAGAGLDTVAVLHAALEAAAAQLTHDGCGATPAAPPPLVLTRAPAGDGERLRLCADAAADAHRCLGRFVRCPAAP